MKKQKRTIHFDGLQLRQNPDGSQSRTIEGYAIVFDSPSVAFDVYADGRTVREVVAPEAVTLELLNRSDIKMTMYHNREIILARSNKGSGTLKYEIDEKGVKFSFKAPNTQYGDEAVELLSRGDLSGCSFAFWCDYGRDVDVVQTEDATLCTVRHIDEIFDFTLATDPAYPETSVSLRELTGEPEPQPELATQEPEPATQEPEPATQESEPETQSTNNTPNTETMKKKQRSNKLTAYVREQLKSQNRQFSLMLIQREETPDNTVVTDDGAAGGIVPISVQEILDQVNEGLIYDKVGMPLGFNAVGELLWPTWTAGEAKIVGETETIAPQEINLDKLNMRPERLAVRFDVSRKALDQTDGVLENIVMKALANSIKRAINKIAFSTTKPDGAASLQGPLVKASATPKTISATPKLKDFTTIKGELFKSGIDGLQPCWVMNNAMKSDLEATPKDTGSGIMLIEDNKLLGYPVFATEVVGANTVAFGDWSYQPASFFGTMELIVDPYSAAAEGKVRFILNLEYGTTTLRPEAFVVGKKA